MKLLPYILLFVAAQLSAVELSEIDVAVMSSGTATSGYAPVADGAGGISWSNVAANITGLTVSGNDATATWTSFDASGAAAKVESLEIGGEEVAAIPGLSVSNGTATATWTALTATSTEADLRRISTATDTFDGFVPIFGVAIEVLTANDTLDYEYFDTAPELSPGFYKVIFQSGFIAINGGDGSNVMLRVGVSGGSILQGSMYMVTNDDITTSATGTDAKVCINPSNTTEWTLDGTTFGFPDTDSLVATLTCFVYNNTAGDISLQIGIAEKVGGDSTDVTMGLGTFLINRLGSSYRAP